MKEVCHDVRVEPHLLPITSETFQTRSASRDQEARLDVSTLGLWGNPFQRTFFDIRVFNPFASSTPKPIERAYQHHESEKMRKYAERVRNVENGTFCPMVFSTTGGAGDTAKKVFKKIASLLSEKQKESYSDTMNFIRTRISFALLRSTLVCLRGSRGHKKLPPIEEAISNVNSLSNTNSTLI